MTMTCEHVDTMLSAWLEGELGQAERRAMDVHLRECLRCASLVRDIEAIRREAAMLPAMAPSRDLWEGIAARIEAPVIELKPRQAPLPTRRTWQMAAAAVLLMAVSSGVTYMLAISDQRSAIATNTGPDSVSMPMTSVAATTPNVVTPRRPTSGSGSAVLVGASAEPMGPEVMLGQEITRLRTILEARRVDLDTATVSAVEKSLKAIDIAIAEARAALAADASSSFLNDQLNRALEKKVGVLRRVALLPVGAS
jgi:predicted anti-sigma-YlaC factor YlaD